jgi:hypothetical protein
LKLLRDLMLQIAELASNRRNSLQNSLLAGNLTSQTGPIRTVSSASRRRLSPGISGTGESADLSEG